MKILVPKNNPLTKTLVLVYHVILTTKLLPSGNVKCLRFLTDPNEVFILGQISVEFVHSHSKIVVIKMKIKYTLIFCYITIFTISYKMF